VGGGGGGNVIRVYIINERKERTTKRGKEIIVFVNS